MGNHEYCEFCGENDFHYGQPCDPKKVAKVKKERAKRDRELLGRIAQLEADAPSLEKLGYRLTIDTQYGYGMIWPK